MAKPTSARDLQTAITRIEESLPQLVASINEADRIVADEMADPEGKIDAALDRLAKAKDRYAAAVKSHGELDVRLFDAMSLERKTADDKLQAKLNDDLAKFSDAIVKALAGFASLVGADAVQTMTVRALKIGTEALEEQRFQAPLPPWPREPRPRNAAGKPKTDQELNSEWTPSASSIWTGPATATPARAPSAFDWLAKN